MHEMSPFPESLRLANFIFCDHYFNPKLDYSFLEEMEFLYIKFCIAVSPPSLYKVGREVILQMKWATCTQGWNKIKLNLKSKSKNLAHLHRPLILQPNDK